MKSFKEQPNYETKEKSGQTAEELTRKIAQAYDGKSNTDMMMSILKETEESKRAGTLTNQEIDAFYAAFSPMLDATKRKRLENIVHRLKEI